VKHTNTAIRVRPAQHLLGFLLLLLPHRLALLENSMVFQHQEASISPKKFQIHFDLEQMGRHVSIGHFAANENFFFRAFREETNRKILSEFPPIKK
jgi:hypothetical protein